jgi:hypothetical protein
VKENGLKEAKSVTSNIANHYSATRGYGIHLSWHFPFDPLVREAHRSVCWLSAKEQRAKQYE